MFYVHLHVFCYNETSCTNNETYLPLGANFFFFLLRVCTVAENVKKILVSEYGIDPDKIILNPIGSREQVYERTSLNRIVRVTIVR